MSPANTPSAPPEKSRKVRTSHLVGALFLATQIAFVLVTHFSADDPRLLTPTGGFTRYDLNVSYETHVLSPKAVRARYGIAPRDDVSLKTAAIQNLIAHREKPIPLSRANYVRLRTRFNGGLEEFWLWPQE